MRTHHTSAWSLSQLCVAVIVYASLYPFDQWRDQDIAPWAFLVAPWPKYWTGFDVVANVLGYAPLGFFLALSALRLHWRGSATLWATLLGALLSLLMEGVQSYLPARVPSQVDFLLNTLGAGLGAALASLLEQWGLLHRWSQFRSRWFVRDAHLAVGASDHQHARVLQKPATHDEFLQVAARQGRHLEHLGAGFLALERGGVGDGVTDDELDELVLAQLRQRLRADDSTIAQDRYVVGDLEHLVERTGARALLTRGLAATGGLPEAYDVEADYQRFVDYYAANIAHSSAPFPGLVALLASPWGGYLTGATFHVDGGRRAALL